MELRSIESQDIGAAGESGQGPGIKDVQFLLYARHCGRCVMIYEQHMY